MDVETNNELLASIVQNGADAEGSSELRKSQINNQPENLSASLRCGLIFIRLVSLLFSNLKLCYISIQLSLLTDINNAIDATGVSKDCGWFWGPFYNTFADDDYNPSLTSGNSDTSFFKMTCPTSYCDVVCPGDCDTSFYRGSSMNETDIYNTPLQTCTLTFHYYNATFALILTALIVDALFQFLLGLHMLYVHCYPGKGRWYFIQNLHQRSIYAAVIYILRPGMLYNFLKDPALAIYPGLPDVRPVPFWYFLLFALFIDAPNAIGAFLWALFNGSSLSIYLAIASLLNIGVNFMFMYFLQIQADVRKGNWRI
ncbi:hypothetical protein EON65_38275 [archaeon]|nr:MAG: hypothetical protein EON65_38275 [archaeon]